MYDLRYYWRFKLKTLRVLGRKLKNLLISLAPYMLISLYLLYKWKYFFVSFTECNIFDTKYLN